MTAFGDITFLAAGPASERSCSAAGGAPMDVPDRAQVLKLAEPPLAGRVRYLSANRQRIVELFPTAHRRAFDFQERQTIVEIAVGDTATRAYRSRATVLFWDHSSS